MREFVLILHAGAGAGEGAAAQTLHAQFRDERRAREFATARLAENPDILEIAIAEGGRELARIQRD